MGALVADEYRQLLICSPSELWFDDFGWNVLWYAEVCHITPALLVTPKHTHDQIDDGPFDYCDLYIVHL